MKSPNIPSSSSVSPRPCPLAPNNNLFAPGEDVGGGPEGLCPGDPGGSRQLNIHLRRRKPTAIAGKVLAGYIPAQFNLL